MEELRAIKFYRKLCELNLDLQERNYAYALEAFWHLIHDTKCCISQKSIELCKNIVLNPRSEKKGKESFITHLAKSVFKTTITNFTECFNEMKKIKKEFQALFSSGTLESFLTRNYLVYYENIFKIRFFMMGQCKEKFDLIKNGLVMRKCSMKSIDYLRKKNSDLKLHSGSYETLTYLWSFINHLMSGMQFITEYYTLAGIDREAQKYQHEYFIFSVRYCVPYRTKLVVRMMMHTEFISLRVPELGIREAQLQYLQKNIKPTSKSINYSNQDLTVQPDVAEYHYGLLQQDSELDSSFSRSTKSKKVEKYGVITITGNNNKPLEISLESCFLVKSIFKVELLRILAIVKSYIWKIEEPSEQLSVDNTWENHFIEKEEDEEELLSDEMSNINLCTPPSSPQKRPSTPEAIMNAPVRPKRTGPMPKVPTILKNERKGKKGIDEHAPIETFETVYLPDRVRNIKYEEPELPRAVLRDSKRNRTPCAPTSSITPVDASDSPSLIAVLEQHVTQFLHLNVPVIHRPIYQRLGLHFLSSDPKKAAYYFSLAISIGFRQLYLSDGMIKLLSAKETDVNRWSTTCDEVHNALVDEPALHGSLERLMPPNWTVLQFSIVDEIPVSCIRSSLLNNVDGGCLGARNVALLLVTKYQSLPDAKGRPTLKIETRVLHGFRKTGMQLIDQLESLKSESARTLKLTVRKQWWASRYSADSQMKALTDQMRTDWLTESAIKWLMDEDGPLEYEPKILIPDRNLNKVPLECLLSRDNARTKCITRMPSMLCLVGHLHQQRFRNLVADRSPSSVISRLNLEVDPFNAFFLVNPDNTLQETEDAVLPLFKKRMNWDGLTGNSHKQIDPLYILTNKDMLIYCGHGTGNRYLIDKGMKSVTSSTSVFLIGCQSARFIVEGRSEAFGMIMAYLNVGCPSVFGLLWDVTDREIDKFTVTMLSNWLDKVDIAPLESDTYRPVAPMPSYVFNRDTINDVVHKNLTGNSGVVFGLPIWVDNATRACNW